VIDQGDVEQHDDQGNGHGEFQQTGRTGREGPK
jgi:hypothetical protein